MSRPHEAYRGRPTDRLPTPSLAGLEARGNVTLDPLPGCDAVPTPNWCHDSLAFIPNPATGWSVSQGEPLFLFLHGAGNTTDQFEHILITAAFSGYRTIGIPWDAWSISATEPVYNGTLTRWRQCASVFDHDGDSGTPDQLTPWPVCGDPCQHDMATEMLTGVEIDDAISPYDAHPMRSIVHRTALVLNDLYLEDVADTVNDTHWDDFCDVAAGETQIEWSDVVIGGFSMGGTMAGFISYTEGTQGLFLVEGGSDICWDDTESPPVLVTEDYYDDTTPCQDATNGCDNAIGAWHVDSDAGGAVAGEPGVLAPLGLFPDGNGALLDLDCHLGGTTPSCGTLDFATAASNIATTSQEPANATSNFHGCMAADEHLPDKFLLGDPADPAQGDTNALYLFPAYLEALCTLF